MGSTIEAYIIKLAIAMYGYTIYAYTLMRHYVNALIQLYANICIAE
jgi:hypothetical protein